MYLFNMTLTFRLNIIGKKSQERWKLVMDKASRWVS